jgi:hypothetical protein
MQRLSFFIKKITYMSTARNERYNSKFELNPSKFLTSRRTVKVVGVE